MAVERIAAPSRSHGRGDRITAVQHDLHRSFPRDRFDLIVAHYLHIPCDRDRVPALRPAARAHYARAGGRHPLQGCERHTWTNTGMVWKRRPG